MLKPLSLFGALSVLSAAALAGSLDAPGAPAAGSGMPTTAAIYNRLDTGAAIAAPGAFQEPGAGPAATGRSLAEIEAKLPAPDNASGATAAEVAAGKRFWGLRTDGTWGPTSGSAAAGGDVSGPNGALTFSIPDGIYAGRHATAADSNLTAGNIRSGVTLFGVTGTAAVPSGNAATDDVLAGKRFSSDSGSGITGTMPNNGAVNITPTTSAQPIPAGYHNGAGTVAGDAGLVSGNIRSGATIFGVSGSVTAATGNAGAGDVLAGKSFSNGSGAGISGTMPDRGAVNITPSTSSQAIPAGYHNGSGAVAGDPNLAAGNIKSGVTLFGVSGTLTGIDLSRVATLACKSQFAGPTCEACAGQWSGPNCDVCPTGWSGSSCDTCAENWSGPSCDVCAYNWSSPGCSSCTEGWTGTHCDVIPKPFPTTPPTYAATPWKCVFDSATGLTWEVKTADGKLHHYQWVYTWYDPTAVDPGQQTDASCIGDDPGLVTCDTNKFIHEVNAEQLCGYSDWRLPTVTELTSLVRTGAGLPAIDTAYFPNTEDNRYWTSESATATSAKTVAFFDGRVETWSKMGSSMYTRLVRGP